MDKFSTPKICEVQGFAYEKLSNEGRKTMDAMLDDNALFLIEEVLQGLAQHRSTSLFEPHPYNQQFNLRVQELIKKYRNQIEL